MGDVISLRPMQCAYVCLRSHRLRSMRPNIIIKISAKNTTANHTDAKSAAKYCQVPRILLCESKEANK